MGSKLTYFVEHEKEIKGATQKIISMLEFLNDNIFLDYGLHTFHHVIGILMDTNCAPLLVHFIFLYYYLVEFI